jgi:hypothetical protein
MALVMLVVPGAASLAGATFGFARTALAVGLGLLVIGGLALLVISMLAQPATRFGWIAIVILGVILTLLLLGLADSTYPRNRN